MSPGPPERCGQPHVRCDTRQWPRAREPQQDRQPPSPRPPTPLTGEMGRLSARLAPDQATQKPALSAGELGTTWRCGWDHTNTCSHMPRTGSEDHRRRPTARRPVSQPRGSAPAPCQPQARLSPARSAQIPRPRAPRPGQRRWPTPVWWHRRGMLRTPRKRATRRGMLQTPRERASRQRPRASRALTGRNRKSNRTRHKNPNDPT